MVTVAGHPIEKHRLLTLLLLAALSAIAFQGSRGLYEPTEARYAEVAREMMVSGDYVHPTLSQKPHYTKPPLTYWTIAAGMKLLGVNAWGARLGNVLAFVLTALALSEIGAIVWGGRAGWIAGIIYISSPLPFGGVAVVSSDTLLTLWVVLTMLAFVKSREAPRMGARRWWIRAMWVFLGLGFMTKGPPALLPLAAIIAFRLIARRKTGLADPLGMGLFLVVGLWWYLLVIYQRHELLQYFIGQEVVARNLTGSAHRNSQWFAPLAIYLPTLIVGALPWIGFVIRRSAFTHPRTDTRQTGGLFRDLSGLVTFWWFVVPLALFCLSKSRLPLYMLQVFPPLALWITSVIVRSDTRTRTLLATACATLLVLIAIKAVSPHVPYRKDAARLYAATQTAGGPGTRLLLVAHDEQPGLEFYYGGEITRISPAGSTQAAVDELIAEVARGRTARSHTFVVDPGYTAQVTRALDKTHTRYERSTASDWDLLVCRAGPIDP